MTRVQLRKMEGTLRHSPERFHIRPWVGADMTAPPDTAYPAAPAGDPALLNRIAWTSRWASRKRSLEHARTVLASCSPTGNARARTEHGRALITVGWQQKWCGSFDEAMKSVLAAETLLPEVGFPEERAHGYSILGVVHYSRNRLDLASSAVERGLSLVEPERGCEAFVDLLTTRATVQRYNGDRSRAGLSIARAREMASGPDLARVEHNVARWMLADGAPSAAAEHATRALELAETHRNRVILPYAYEVMGAALAEQTDYSGAEAAFASGLTIAIEDEDRRVQCQIVERHAALELKRGDLETARDLYGFGVRIADDLGYALWQRSFALGLAEVYERMGEYKLALAQHKRAWDIEKGRRT